MWLSVGELIEKWERFMPEKSMIPTAKSTEEDADIGRLMTFK